MSLPFAPAPAPVRDVPARAPDAAAVAQRYRDVRARSQLLAMPLSPEDAMVQSMDSTSPAKWHLAHTSWFFECFVLGLQRGYAPVHPDWDYLFNSYYHSVGAMHARPQRGLLSRPGLSEVLAYRDAIDARIAHGFAAGDFDQEALRRIMLGTHHEQQHQELLLTDIKHALWCNPLRPAYRDDLPQRHGGATPLHWIASGERLAKIGAPAWPAGGAFAYDNESPRHRVLVPAHALASRPVSNAEYRAFVDDDGYRTATLWMSEGWSRVQAEGWSRPLYWDQDLAGEFTLGGMRALDAHAPVCHLSYFEADAFARWAGARLPTETEWESHAATQPVEGNFADDDLLHPASRERPLGAAPTAAARPGLQQLFGDVWEWTSSAYSSYPGFRALPGALGEYNGKFMCGQWVLRGGSCATPRGHMRASYRNFFYPPDRWQFSGLRLAKDPA
ncbi:ergothioneine biosynthesis protein EgtB [Lysobacter sp. D1-1-M9]|uniref:ergothioneine biosynthesis protein EgtB n=1 Tax=Novilysobacter longmucuonensis TaxID=3098603 RepID=UPI003200B17A